jgi:hypothetical protein
MNRFLYFLAVILAVTISLDAADIEDIDKFWETRSHPSFKELVRLDVKLTNAINSGEYKDGLYNSIREQVEDNIAILSKDGEISKAEMAKMREYFAKRLHLYDVGGGPNKG